MTSPAAAEPVTVAFRGPYKGTYLLTYLCDNLAYVTFSVS